MQEYMNSANKEKFSVIHARCNHTILISSSKNTYISDKLGNGFMPLFGKTPGNFHFKKVDHAVFMADDYVLLMDSVKNIYRYELNSQK